MLFSAGLFIERLRFAGKYFGIFLSGAALKIEKPIKTYLGLSLLPQAGVAIGLMLFVQASPIVQQASLKIQNEIAQMTNIILMSVFVNEVIGPPLSKFAILKNLKRRK